MANPEDDVLLGHAAGWRTRLRVWCGPVVVVLVLMALLGTLYLAYVINPQKNLHNFPIALVNQDVGDVLNGKVTNVGQQLADGLVAGIPKQQIDLRVVGIGTAEYQLQTGQVYGAIIIPSDLTKRLFILAAGSVVSGDIDQPIVTVRTNPRVGTYATQIVQRIAGQALDQANETVGEQLIEQVKAQLKNTPISATSQLVLSAPIREVVAPYHPLPDGTGQGLSAFFYTLLLLLAGFTGAMIINTMTDSTLGFIPMEYGPWYLHRGPPAVSRFRTLMLKWALLTVAALLVAGVFLLVGKAEGMPIDYPLALYLYSVFAILAVGYTALSVLAAIGNAGLLVNLVLFVVLGLPSCGGTVPVEAVPRYIAWLARFEPMHQVFLGVRAILYFEARLDAGLSRAGWMTLLGLVIGIALGVSVTLFYDRRGLRRAPQPR